MNVQRVMVDERIENMFVKACPRMWYTSWSSIKALSKPKCTTTMNVLNKISLKLLMPLCRETVRSEETLLNCYKVCNVWGRFIYFNLCVCYYCILYPCLLFYKSTINFRS